MGTGTRRIGLAALALVMAGCGGTRVPEAEAPTAGTSPLPDPAARARRELTTLRELVDADPKIAAVMGLTAKTEPQAARTMWKAGRAALRHLAERHELARILAEMQRAPPTPEGFAELSRLTLTMRLLAAAHPPEPEPLFPAGQDPGLDRALSRGLEVRIEPAIDGRTFTTPAEGRDRYRAELSLDGRRWKPLRCLEETHIPDGPGLGYNPRIWRQSPAGERFKDPTEGIPTVMLGQVYPERDRVRLERSIDRIEAAIDPGDDDLFLVLLAWNLHGTTHPTIDLVGRDLTVPVVIGAPPGSQALLGLPENVTAGLAIRIRREVLPVGLRKLVIRMIALQPIGRPEATCNATELLQLVGGPVPAVFAGHRWASP